MIISASRRTDIPAFYSEWFINRIRESCVMVKNPFNRKQVTKVSLNPLIVDAIVFWTKNPAPMISKIRLLEKYNIFFHFTLNSYGKEFEPNLPSAEDRLMTFQKLAGLLPAGSVIWRYDPIFFTPHTGVKEHFISFRELAENLHPYTERCMISFLTDYAKCRKNMKYTGYRVPELHEMEDLASMISSAGRELGIEIFTCASEYDLSRCGIKPGACIDAEYLSKISGRTIADGKDKNQRKFCRCSESTDIGSYNTCPHGCRYCYANYDHRLALKNFRSHSIDSEILCGTLQGDEIIRQKNCHTQLKLFE